MAKYTKGYIVRSDTSERLTFQFNPSTFDYGRSANYAITSAPGMNYPLASFISGAENAFTVDLFFFSKDPNDKVIADSVNFLKKLFPGETNTQVFSKPPEFIFCMGTFIKRCVGTSYKVHIEDWSNTGKPTNVVVTVGMLQVGVK